MIYHKKSQAAFEFLMTYGWAIGIASVAIVALAYFGVLSPEKFLPQRCSFKAGISCLDFSYEVISDIPTLKFVIKNNLGRDIRGISIIVPAANTGGSDCSTVESKPTTLKNDEQGTFIYNCDPAIPKGKIKTNLFFSYTQNIDPTEPFVPRFAIGTLIFNVE